MRPTQAASAATAATTTTNVGGRAAAWGLLAAGAKLREKTQRWVYDYKTSETTQATVLGCDDSDED